MAKFLDSAGVKILWQELRKYGVKRDNDYNYAATFIPKNGQICFVDTAKNGLRIKIGDGVTEWASIPYFSGSLADDENPGVMKLYQDFGENEDGSISQRVLTLRLNSMEEKVSGTVKASINSIDECLIFSQNI